MMHQRPNNTTNNTVLNNAYHVISRVIQYMKLQIDFDSKTRATDNGENTDGIIIHESAHKDLHHPHY